MIKLLKNDKFIFISILIIGVFLRCFLFNDVPGGINVDEASIGYESWCISNYGVDRNLKSFPINLIAWGSGQNAVYAYLCIPFIKLFGLSAFTTRLPSLILGILTLPLMYLVTKKLFNNKKIALLSMFTLAVMPWHIMISRWALESNIFPFFFLLGTYFLVASSREKMKHMYISVAIYAFSMYTYATSYFFMPLFLLSMIPYLMKVKNISIKDLIILIVVFTVLILPIILLVLINIFNLDEITIFNITIPKYILSETRFKTVSEEGGGVRNNIDTLIKCVIEQNDDLIHNSIKEIGLYYNMGIAFVVVGIIVSIKNWSDNRNIEIILNWLIFAIFLGIVSSINVNRINIIWLVINIFCAYGLYYIINSYNYSKIFTIIVILVYFLSIAGFIYIYYSGTYNEYGEYDLKFNNDSIKSSYNIGFDRAVDYADYINDKEIYICNRSSSLYQPYIYMLFYNPVSPYEFNENVVFNPIDEYTEFTTVKKLYDYNFYFQGEEDIYKSGNVYVINVNVLYDDLSEKRLKSEDMTEEQEFGNFRVFKMK